MDRKALEIHRAKGLASNIRGNEMALSKLITLIENNPYSASEIMPLIHPLLAGARTIGFTGPPGAGKSCLIGQVISSLVDKGKKVGIIAIDPTSQFSKGALLGDRTRMHKHYMTPGVFIRSMATRGNHGGLARSTRHVIKLMDAFGVDEILVETVGVGQTELDVMDAAEITVVVLVPEAGDSIQAMKAGVMEIGDIFVINKSDRPNAEESARELATILEMNPKYAQDMPPIILTQATTGAGIENLVSSLQELQRRKLEDGETEAHHRRGRKREIEELLCEHVLKELDAIVRHDEHFQECLKEVVEGRKDPHAALQEIFPGHILARS